MYAKGTSSCSCLVYIAGATLSQPWCFDLSVFWPHWSGLLFNGEMSVRTNILPLQHP